MWGRFFPIILQWRVTISHIKDALRAPSITHLLRCSSWILKGIKNVNSPYSPLVFISVRETNLVLSSLLLPHLQPSPASVRSCTNEILHKFFPPFAVLRHLKEKLRTWRKTFSELTSSSRLIFISDYESLVYFQNVLHISDKTRIAIIFSIPLKHRS